MSAPITTTPAGPGKSASIREVARIARVSEATVSRVLNGTAPVREERRQRVLDAVAQVDYRPNRLALNLRRQNVGMIGVVVADIANPHFSEAVRVIEDSAYAAGYRVLLCNTDETAQKQRGYLEMLADERVIAAIVSPVDSEGDGVDELLALNIPVVAFDRAIDHPSVDAVVCDNTRGARLATEHLLGLGHTRIAFVGGRMEVETGTERFEGWSSAMFAAGLETTAVDGGFRAEVAEVAVERLLTRARSRPSALLVSNNLMGLGAIRASRRAGLSIPEDIAIVTVDDPIWAEHVDPPLTTLAQPVREMATTAMRLALERVAGHAGAGRRVVLDLELRVRSSCGAQLAVSARGM